MIQREVKLTFIEGKEGFESLQKKKTLSFGYIKEDVTHEEVKELGDTILNSGCYDFLELVGASIVATETEDIKLK